MRVDCSSLNLRCWGRQPRTTPTPRTLSRPTTTPGSMMACTSRVVPSPIETPAPTTASGPTVTPAPRSAVRSTTAVGWMRGGADVVRSASIFPTSIPDGERELSLRHDDPADERAPRHPPDAAAHPLHLRLQRQPVAGHDGTAEPGAFDPGEVRDAALPRR